MHFTDAFNTELNVGDTVIVWSPKFGFLHGVLCEISIRPLYTSGSLIGQYIIGTVSFRKYHPDLWYMNNRHLPLTKMIRVPNETSNSGK